MKTDAEILDWLERNHTLHSSVEALYVVDGYEVDLMIDGDAEVGLMRGATLREAYSAAMAWEFDTVRRSWVNLNET